MSGQDFVDEAVADDAGMENAENMVSAQPAINLPRSLSGSTPTAKIHRLSTFASASGSGSLADFDQSAPGAPGDYDPDDTASTAGSVDGALTSKASGEKTSVKYGMKLDGYETLKANGGKGGYLYTMQA